MAPTQGSPSAPSLSQERLYPGMWIRALVWSLQITPAEFGDPQSGWPPKDTKLPGCHLKANGQKRTVKRRDAAVHGRVTGKTTGTLVMAGREKSQEMQELNTLGFECILEEIDLDDITKNQLNTIKACTSEDPGTGNCSVLERSTFDTSKCLQGIYEDLNAYRAELKDFNDQKVLATIDEMMKNLKVEDLIISFDRSLCYPDTLIITNKRLISSSDLLISGTASHSIFFP
ncbi:interleukin-12 subunit alpha [Limosa lapponica baueri]|uniref:Interleukin-12 subunit alpha n=1 Tax=Limosa lapponica baueri TaxID=1758121 RepID=A0A2I0U3W0_LIMLA|nr:interleukin-12 subunit alpha [Limosa lapponica baueri]